MTDRAARRGSLALTLLLLGLLVGVVAVPIGFIPQRDLNDYRRLVDGDGTVVPARLTGGTTVAISGRRGGSENLCASWRYEIDGNERFHTEKHHCFSDESDIDAGARGEIVYDPDDQGIVFEHSDVVLDDLEQTQLIMRLVSVAGAVVLIGCGTGLWLRRRRRLSR